MILEFLWCNSQLLYWQSNNNYVYAFAKETTISSKVGIKVTKKDTFLLNPVVHSWALNVSDRDRVSAALKNSSKVNCCCKDVSDEYNIFLLKSK